jgi:hypothetical protein
MHLASNWREIARRSWSFWLMAVAAILSVAEAVFPFYSDLFDRTTAALITLGLVLSAMIARLVYQKGLSK